MPKAPKFAIPERRVAKRPVHEFTAGGHTYALSFSTNANVALEEVLGCAISDFGNRCGFRELRAMVWAGLWGAVTRVEQDARPPLTLEQAGDLLDLMTDERGQEGAAEIIQQAFQDAFPPAKKGKLADGEDDDSDGAGEGKA